MYNIYINLFIHILFPTMRVMLLDTTLREGEQTPGVAFSVEQKIKIASLLGEFGVNSIEVGFPTSSRGAMEASKAICNLGYKYETLGYARAKEEDIDAVAEAGCDRVVINMPTSDIQIDSKLNVTRELLEEILVRSVNYAINRGLKVRFTPEDSTRTQPDIWRKTIEKAVNAGADRISIADTLGLATPEKMRSMVERLLYLKVGIDLHCHNDFGLALANAIAGMQAGADQIQCTVNGLGERTGIPPLAETVMVLKLLYNAQLDVKTEMLKEISEYVAAASKIPVSNRARFVGDHAFAHTAGIHTAAVLKNPQAYEPVTPESVGNRRRLVMGKFSGKNLIAHKLSELGIALKEEQVLTLAEMVRNAAEQSGEIGDSELLLLVERIRQKEVN